MRWQKNIIVRASKFQKVRSGQNKINKWTTRTLLMTILRGRQEMLAMYMMNKEVLKLKLLNKKVKNPLKLKQRSYNSSSEGVRPLRVATPFSIPVTICITYPLVISNLHGQSKWTIKNPKNIRTAILKGYLILSP